VVPDEVVADLYVLCLVVLNGIMRNINGTLIVAQKRHLVTMNTIILQGFPHPKKLCTTTSGSHIHGFGGGERHTIYLLGRPTNQRPTKELASPES
jgi:hypothetical protein